MSLTALDYHGKTPAHIVDGHVFQPPGSDAARSPCPFLNTLANHGYIHRDGRYVTLWQVTRAIMDCYNFDFALSLLLGASAVYTSAAVAFNPLWFHLDQLKWHGPISVEHDASLSRLDHSEGDSFHANPKLIETMVTFASTPDGLSPEDFGTYRILREKGYPVTELPDPNGLGQALRCGEVGLIMGALGRGDFEPTGRRIHPEWIRSFFGQGRLPDDWTRQERTVSLKQVSDVTEAVKARMAKIREVESKKTK